MPGHIEPASPREDGEDVLGSAIAETAFGTAPAVTAALDDAVRNGRLGYLTPHLLEDVAHAAADWQRRQFGWSVPPEAIDTVPDVLAAYEAVLRHLLPGDGVVVVPTPAHRTLLSVPRTTGHRVVELPMIAGADAVPALDLDGIDRALGPARRGLVVLCNPHNPLGVVHTRAELAALSAVVAARDGLVLADEIFAPLVLPGGPAHVPYATVDDAARGHALTATSVAKGWNLGGLKAAQLVIEDPRLRAAWEARGRHVTHHASTLGVIASVAAYRDDDGWREELVSHLGDHRDTLVDLVRRHLPRVSLRPPEATYLAWLDLRASEPADPVPTVLEECRVRLFDGAQDGAAGRGFARLNFAVPRPVLVEMVTRLARVLG